MKFFRRHYTALFSLVVLVILVTPEIALAEWYNPLTWPGMAATWAGDQVNKAVQQLLFIFVINVFGTFTQIGGSILDAGIDYFVLGFGGTFLHTGMGVAVNNAWVIIRDFVNLFFIFGLVYIGFKMILDIDSSNTRRMLVNLILAALLVNFSLFITKFMIDVSNQVSAEIAVAGLGAEDDDKDGRYESDISQKLFQRMGIVKILQGKPEGVGYGYIMGTAVLLLVAAFVFAAGGILLIIRFTILCIYMLLSPIMFLGWILSPFGDTMTKYWKNFIKRCFFAPVYLLFIYFSLQLIGGLQKSIGNTANTDLANPNWKGLEGNPAAISGQGLGTIPFFVLICVFLIASLVAASKLGAEGADKAVSLGKRWGTKTAKWTGAQTGGRMARGLTNVGGRQLSRGLNRLQTIEGNGIVARTTRNLARSNAVQGTVGAGATAMQQTRFGLGRTIEQDRQMRNQTDARSDRATNARQAQAVPPITGASTDAEIAARQDARRQAQNEVRDMSPEEILERARTNRAELMSPEFASLLSDAQVTALRNSGVLDNDQMDELEQNRDQGTFAEITAVLDNQNASTENLTAAMEDLNRVMSTMSPERLQSMVRYERDPNTGQHVIDPATGRRVLAGPLADNRIASRLNTTQVDAVRNSGQATSAEMRDITDRRDAGFVDIIRNGSLGNPASAGGQDAVFQDRQRRGLFRNAQDAGRLPVDVLAATASQQYLTPRIIEEFLNNNPTDAHIGLVRRNIQDYISSGRAPAGVPDTWNNWSRRTVAGRRFAL